MGKEKLSELNRIFLSLSEADKLKLDDFPYENVSSNFNLKLKEYLQENFNGDIVVDKDEGFYIRLNYKETVIIIEKLSYNGFSLSTLGETNEQSLSELKEILTGIVGMESICTYNYKSIYSTGENVYKTIEWNLNPEKRLSDLVSEINDPFGEMIYNFEDSYTDTIIKSLGERLFTYTGYKKMFNNGFNNPNYTSHKVKQIQKLNPNLSTDVIYAWINSTQKNIELSQENIYQKVYIDDGK